MLLKVRDADPEPPARLNPLVPRDLDAICLKCLEKDPAARYASAADLAADLDRFLRGEPVRAKPIGAARRGLRWVARHPVPSGLMALTTLAVVAAVALGVWNWQRGERHDLELRLAREGEERQRFFAGLERVRQRRDDPYAGWSRETLADLRELARLAPARGHLPDLRSEAASALAATDIVPGPLLADFPAYAAHFSADGRWLAVAGWEANGRGRVELTDQATGARQDVNFPVDPKWVARAGKPDGPRSVRFSPDARWLVAGTRSGWLVRWDMTNLVAEPHAWPAHTEDHAEPRFVAVKTVGFTADGRTVLSASLGAVRGWTVADGRTNGLVLKGSRLPMDFYPITEEVAVYGPDGRSGEYALLRVDNWAFVPDRRFEGTPASCLSPDEWLMACRQSNIDQLQLRYAHPFAAPRPMQLWEDQAVPTHLTFSPAGDLVTAVFEHDLRIRVWDVAAGVFLAERTTEREAPHAVFSPDGRQMVVSGMHGARAYDVPNRVLETVAVVPETEVQTVACPPDHSEVIVAAKIPLLAARLYRTPLALDRPAARPKTATLSLQRIYQESDVSPDGRGLVLSGLAEEGGEGLIQDHTGARLETPKLSDVRYGPDGRLWVLESQHLRVGSGPADAPVVWRNDPASQSAGAALKCVAPGRQFALVGRRDGRVFRVDPNGPVVDSWKVMDSSVRGLAVSPDEGRAAAGGERGEVRLLDPATGAVTDLPDAHRAAVPAVAYGPGFLVTGSADRRVRLWTPDGQPIATLVMRGPVAKVLVSSDGRSLLVRVQGERAVRRWRLDLVVREWAALGLNPALTRP